jgi:predicted MPP superfamily phosphohydrolase
VLQPIVLSGRKSNEMVRLIIAGILFFSIEIYAYQALRVLSNNVWLKGVMMAISIIVTLLTLYIYFIDRESFSIPLSNTITGLFMLFFVSKLIVIVFLFGEDIFRLVKGFVQFFEPGEQERIPSRRKFISQMAVGAALFPFSSLLYGMVKGKYNFNVIRHDLYFDDLPDAFDGYQITHISDLHTGSFDNPEKIEYAVNLINEQQSDAIMITGDIVNLKATELLPWKSTLSQLSAKDGVYSVLGNHDYGRYVQWNNRQEAIDNFKRMQAIQNEMGFRLLMNEHSYISKDNQQIAIVGVENWGVGSVQEGDLEKASRGITKNDFNIVLSHDPTHWDQKILSSEQHHHLTLSGHTHGMQFGIEISGWIKWSPAKWRYKQWAGIYQKQGIYINVNRGLGFVAFPGRTGIWPEITVITLRKKEIS